MSDKSKRIVLLFVDLIALPAALWVSVALRYGDFSKDMSAFWFVFPVVAIVGVLSFYQLGLYRAIVRYIGPSAMLPVVQGVTIAALAVSLVAYMSGETSFPRSAPMIFWFIAILIVGGGRLAVRTYFYGFGADYLTREPVAIFGAGDSGAQLAMALLQDRTYMPVVFVDDDRSLRKKTIHGIRVFSRRHLPGLIEKYGIQRVLLAVPSASEEQRQNILDFLSTLPIHVSTVPAFKELVSGESAVFEMKEVGIGDILGRAVVPPDEELLAQSIAGASILVTGAAGTIGAELCRKILTRRPKRLVLFDNSEFGLYQMGQELQDVQHPETEVVIVLGSILNQALLVRTLEKFETQIVYHAAAYKHVPLVERNMLEGLRNNSIGTWRVLEAVEQTGVDALVMISSDKAVRPTNVMGASKRLAELFVQAFADRATNKTYSMVRFGNVLKSSGSVVPLFEQQIARGGPVTVTHPEATRYFMTCEEAADLVIQAGAMATGGEIFVLDMGEPVLIRDLAEKMIHLHGRRVRSDIHADSDVGSLIDIQYTGLRAGEKLKEELVIGENITGTPHPMVMKAFEAHLNFADAESMLSGLLEACEQADLVALRHILATHVSGYQAAGNNLDPVLSDGSDSPANVTPIR